MKIWDGHCDVGRAFDKNDGIGSVRDLFSCTWNMYGYNCQCNDDAAK